jgi:spore germination cell wall hydrolase CwlJ-like protein
MNKKTIAPGAQVLYPPQASEQNIAGAKWYGLLQIIWRLLVPNLHSVKRGLMHLSLFWRRLAIFAGEIRTQVMVEIERNPLAVRQGAATIMCLAAAAVAMPLIAHRAAEQRDGAEWAATSTAFQAELQQQLASNTEPNARVELTSFRTTDGLRARGSATLFESADARAMMVQAVLRGPSSATTPDQATPAEPQIDARQHACLSQAIYYEARGESQRGQAAVAEVIMNRVRSNAYPNSICGVVYQGSHRATGCQFTFTCDGSLGHRPRGRAWERAQRVATAVMLGYTRPITQGATHYHTHAVNPVWNSGLVETVNVGSHVFYRFPNRSERAYYQEALARRRGTGVRRTTAADDLVQDGVEVEGVTDAATTESIMDAPAEAAPVLTDAPADTEAANHIVTNAAT